jgi:hypothetical protein
MERFQACAGRLAVIRAMAADEKVLLVPGL